MFQSIIILSGQEKEKGGTPCRNVPPFYGKQMMITYCILIHLPLRRSP